MIFRTAATAAALAVALAMIGAVTGPQWNPEPVAEHVRPATDDTVIGGQVPSSPVGTYPVEEISVTIDLDGAQVEAMIRRPEGVDTDQPGVVFLHGAGTGDSRTAFSAPATDLASAGIVTLVPSKRLDTYTLQHRDYVSSASDYGRSVDYLRALDGVDASRVGLYAESEGTWIAPVLATQDPSIDFTVLVSAPVVRPREQGAFAVDAYLRNTDVPHGVFRAIPRAVGMKLPGGGFAYVDFDVEPYLKQLTAPIFVAYGTNDSSMPIEQGAEQVLANAAINDNLAVTVRYYDGANHGIKINDELAPGFSRDLAAWISSLPSSAEAEPQIAGAQPNQPFLAQEVPASRWFGDGDFVLGIVIGALILIALGPLILVTAIGWRRVKGIGGSQLMIRRDFRLPLAGLAVGSIVTLLALVIYLVAVAQLAVNYEKDALTVQGGWLGVRLLGLLTLIPVALLVNRAGELRGARKAARAVGGTGEVVAVGLFPRIALWCLVAGSVSLLVTLAYWGVYQLGI